MLNVRRYKVFVSGVSLEAVDKDIHARLNINSIFRSDLFHDPNYVALDIVHSRAQTIRFDIRRREKLSILREFSQQVRHPRLGWVCFMLDRDGTVHRAVSESRRVPMPFAKVRGHLEGPRGKRYVGLKRVELRHVPATQAPSALQRSRREGYISSGGGRDRAVALESTR